MGVGSRTAIGRQGHPGAFLSRPSQLRSDRRHDAVQIVDVAWDAGSPIRIRRAGVVRRGCPGMVWPNKADLAPEEHCGRACQRVHRNTKNVASSRLPDSDLTATGTNNGERRRTISRGKGRTLYSRRTSVNVRRTLESRSVKAPRKLWGVRQSRPSCGEVKPGPLGAEARPSPAGPSVGQPGKANPGRPPSRRSPIVSRSSGVGTSRKVRRASTKGSQFCVQNHASRSGSEWLLQRNTTLKRQARTSDFARRPRTNRPSGSDQQAPKAGSPRTRLFHARVSAARPGSAG